MIPIYFSGWIWIVDVYLLHPPSPVTMICPVMIYLKVNKTNHFSSIRKKRQWKKRRKLNCTPFELALWMPNRCWLINFVAEAKLLDGINDDRRTFFTEPGLDTDVVGGASSRLSYECFFVCKTSEFPLNLPLFKLLCWNRVLRCFGMGGSFKPLGRLPRSTLDAISNDWNVFCRWFKEKNGNEHFHVQRMRICF